ncbi:hypothetical protein DN745_15200 [Bradymonas sediminis]|uniref:Uncharacterized protein n=1 Tax=Bradymonas sediminis TaxID=1548548 RepID=A0A2Z4FNM2_9DELT|nr:hypothetical protein DN745_15200 [Bradymonas sediminis]
MLGYFTEANEGFFVALITIFFETGPRFRLANKTSNSLKLKSYFNFIQILNFSNPAMRSQRRATNATQFTKRC